MLAVSVPEVIPEGVAAAAPAAATAVAVAAAAVAVVVASGEAIFVKEVIIEAGGAVERAILHVRRTADISDSLGAVPVRVLLVRETLLDELLEVIGAGTTTIVLDVAVVVDQGAGVLKVSAIRAVDDLNLDLVIPVAVILALIEVD